MLSYVRSRSACVDNPCARELRYAAPVEKGRGGGKEEGKEGRGVNRYPERRLSGN